MRVFQETTSDWSGDVANHIYYTDDSKSKIYAFYNVVTKEIKELRTPIRWDMRRRTFKELKHK